MTFPLTQFLISLLKATPDQRPRADADKLAEKYGISPDHARGYLEMREG